MDWKIKRKVKALRYGLIRFENTKKTQKDLRELICRAKDLSKTKMGVKKYGSKTKI